ncbi:MAG TPA: hypothetical protein VEI83_02705 [Acidimicrobiales bacterium]|nr:hypothetical protein [Acidimicrobiales bacterium]
MRGTAERRRGASRAGSEIGFTLVEVVVAGTIMIMVLVPSAMLLSSSARVLSVTQAKIVAANLAAGVLDEDRALAGTSSWTGSPVAPTLPAPATPTTVNGIAFTVTQAAGWCTLAAGSGSWSGYATPPTPPAAYGILVTVKWLSGSHWVTSGETLATPGVVAAAGTGNPGGAPSTSGSCPL